MGLTDHVTVTVRPHPFREERQTAHVPQGQTIAALLALAGLDPDDAGPVLVDGEPVPRCEWNVATPRAGQTVTSRAVPRGAATNKNGPIRAALAFITHGTSEAWRQVYNVVGFNPNPLSGLLWQSATPSLDGFGNGQGRKIRHLIEGTRNEARPYSPVPRIFGYRVRYTPPLAALPYSTWVGNKQHFHMLFCFGYGPLYLEDHRIGDTPVSAFGMTPLTGTQTPSTNTAANMQVRPWGNETALYYYLNNVSEAAVGASLTYNTSGARSPWSVRRTAAAVTRIAVEVGFPQGLIAITNTSTGYAKLAVEVEVYYAPAGTAIPSGGDLGAPGSGWTPAYGRSDTGTRNSHAGVKINDARKAAFAIGIDWDVTSGQYDVALRRKTADRNGLSDLDDTVWSKLTNYRLSTPVNLTGLALVSMDIVATGNLNGVLDNYNALASSMSPWYDSDAATWRTPTTTDTPTLESSGQPAGHYRAILQGSGNALAVADARIDLTTLQTWAAATKSHGLHFAGAFETNGSVFDALTAVAAMGRASFTMKDGKFSVVQDLDAQTTPIQHITPRNSWNFQGSHAWPEPVHALRVQYTDTTKDPSKGSALTEIVVYDDGYNADGSGGSTAATVFESLSLPYCNDMTEAWKHGRRALAERRLRRDVYTVEMDVEHLVANRGDLVVLGAEVFDSTPSWGRVKTVTLNGSSEATAITTDESLTTDGSSTYKFRFRLPSGTGVEASVGTPAAGSATSFTFATPIAAASVPSAGDLFLFGLNSVTFRRCLIQRIEPLADLAARVTLVDEASGVYSADTGTSTATAPATGSATSSSSTTLTVAASSGTSSSSPTITVTVTTHGGGGHP